MTMQYLQLHGLDKCNFKQRARSFTPVFFHKLNRSDRHYLIKYSTLQEHEKLTDVPWADKLYISFSLPVFVENYLNEQDVIRIILAGMRFS